MVKPFSSGAFIGLPPDFSGLEALRDLVLAGITVDAPEFGDGGDLLSAAHGAGLATWVAGLRSDEDRQRALMLGASYGSGRLYPPESPAAPDEPDSEG